MKNSGFEIVDGDMIMIPRESHGRIIDEEHRRERRGTVANDQYLWPNNLLVYKFDTVSPVCKLVFISKESIIL